MSFQDVRHHYLEQDDEPPQWLVPSTPVPGKRYIASQRPNAWDVFDWQPEECVYCDGGRVVAFVGCRRCSGIGIVLVPILVAAGLEEQDARTLAFGPKLVETARQFMALLEAAAIAPDKPADARETMRRLAVILRDDLSPLMPGGETP
jgi:hypothetical protein